MDNRLSTPIWKHNVCQNPLVNSLSRSDTKCFGNVIHRTSVSNTNVARPSVLVIEAGADRKNDPRVYTPGLMSLIYGDPELDWDYATPPQVRKKKKKKPAATSVDIRY